jgi:ABC-type polysaccharide/polyol phosphate export permease
MGKYLLAIWQCRYFWLSLVRMDLRTRYRRSILGMGWSLLHPIAMTAIICVVFPRFMGLTDRDFVLRVYVPHVLAGLACWNYILFVALQGCQCFYQGEMYIRQFPAPMAIFPLRTALGGSIHFLIALMLVVAVTGFFQQSVDFLALASLLPSILLLFVFVWSVAVIAGFANVFFNDTQHLAEIGFQIMFYATPIIYLPERVEGSRLGRIIQFNPVYGFLKLIREPIINHQAPSPATYAAACGTVLVFVTAAALILARFQKKLIFKL